jgi:hypothetical protein
MIQSGPLSRISLVRCQSPWVTLETYAFECALDERIAVSVEIGEDAVLVLEASVGFLGSLGRKPEDPCKDSRNHE